MLSIKIIHALMTFFETYFKILFVLTEKYIGKLSFLLWFSRGHNSKNLMVLIFQLSISFKEQIFQIEDLKLKL